MKRDLNKLSSTEYDVVVVGAGIYGVNAAWDGVLRGLKVALIDKGDFTNATSSNSLKTIHGGLRYLQQMDFIRMRRSILERMALMKIAPHLVYPLPVVMPTYSYKLKSRPALFAALLVNDIIGFDRNRLNDPHKYIPASHIISKKKTQEYIPGYEKYNMTGAALWYDCQSYNTERLALSYVLSAAEAGADIANYVECIGFIGNRNEVKGIKARDSFTGDIFDIRAKIVANMGGPWVDTILSNFNAKPLKKGLTLSSAMNIIVNRKLLDKHAAGLSGPYQYERKDGSLYKGYRILFFVPWRDFTIIGTNHLPYHGKPGQYRVKEEEIHDFLNAVNQAYPAADIKRNEVSFFHGGLLPMTGLKKRTGEVRLLRRYVIYDHWVTDKIYGLISVLGVKYTTHRFVASKTIDLVFKKLGRKSPRCLTEEIPIYGGHIERFEDYLSSAIKENEFEKRVIRHLVYNYGSKYKDILSYGQRDQSWLQIVDGSDEVLRAEILNSVQNEVAQKLSDVVLRRTDLGSAGNPGDTALRAAAEIMAKELNWDEERIKKEIQETRAIYIPAN
ncbi:MAG: FAD-dependent oxidoreductase [Candidatus Aminicenantaceae bacterium]